MVIGWFKKLKGSLAKSSEKISDGIKKAVFWLEEIFFNNKGKVVDG